MNFLRLFLAVALAPHIIDVKILGTAKGHRVTKGKKKGKGAKSTKTPKGVTLFNHHIIFTNSGEVSIDGTWYKAKIAPRSKAAYYFNFKTSLNIIDIGLSKLVPAPKPAPKPKPAPVPKPKPALVPKPKPAPVPKPKPAPVLSPNRHLNPNQHLYLNPNQNLYLNPNRHLYLNPNQCDVPFAVPSCVS